ncbi:cobalt-precorrin-6A reductase [Mycobacterium sp.]|uniref:cobalt-precorrin-6A reductase n=1 Tax=Mycobacterium sp. TaxID=1785 RepID=UPI003C70906A
MRVLLLGGTAEGRALAQRLHPDVEVISSLAGRVPDPALPVGQVRIGGFGGAQPMRQWLVENRVDAVVDATHPFAAAMTERAARVCADLGLPHVVVARPPWDSSDAIAVASAAEAAEVVEQQRYSRVFLTSGRSTISAFAHSSAWFLIRVVIAPNADALPTRHTLLLSRGPYRYDDEIALMREHNIHVLVTKNSGGDYTRAKLDAAAALYIPVVMIDRPPLPPGVTTVGTVDEAVAWVTRCRRDG